MGILKCSHVEQKDQKNDQKQASQICLWMLSRSIKTAFMSENVLDVGASFNSKSVVQTLHLIDSTEK